MFQSLHFGLLLREDSSMKIKQFDAPLTLLKLFNHGDKFDFYHIY